ncbi:MAG: STAS domain-containing protein [Nitrospinota bacterium]
MECTLDEQQNFVILRIDGNMKTEEDYGVFKDYVDGILDQGKKNIIVDLKKLEYMNSAGLGRLILTSKKCGKLGGTLRAVGLSEEMNELFTMTRLIETIKVFVDEQEAMNA